MTDISDLSGLKPRITVFGAGGNAVNNMITAGLEGVEFVVANTDAQALTMSKAARTIQMGTRVTQGLGAGSQPEVGRAAAEEVIEEIRGHFEWCALGVRHRWHGWRHWDRSSGRHRKGGAGA
jgi:cell division protein FtsZ